MNNVTNTELHQFTFRGRYFMNRYDLFFYCSFVWIPIGIILGITYDNSIFVILMFFVIPNLFVATHYVNKNDLKQNYQNIADYMQQERHSRKTVSRKCE